MFFAVNLTEYTQALPSGDYRAVGDLRCLGEFVTGGWGQSYR